MHVVQIAQRFEYSRLTSNTAFTAGITSAMRNKKATLSSGFCFFEHCRACTKQCSEITKDSVQSTAFLLHIAEDSKGKALSEADASLRSSQSRLKNFPLYTLITWLHLHLTSSFLLVEPLINHSPIGAVATSYEYDFQTTNEAL